jgi:hypothetical protein
MPIDIHAMTPARWNTMRHLTSYVNGMDSEAMSTMTDFFCSTMYDLRDLKLTVIIPGVERTRCQYLVGKVKGLMEPLSHLHVSGQVEIQWMHRNLVDNPELRKETAKWFEELGRDIMGRPSTGDSIVTGEQQDKEVEEMVADSVSSAPVVPVTVVITPAAMSTSDGSTPSGGLIAAIVAPDKWIEGETT